MQNQFFRCGAALVLTLAFAVSAALPGFAVCTMPIQTASADEAVYLFDVSTGEAVLDQNADQQRSIASLTKMMTALLFLESGKDMNEKVTVPASLKSELDTIRSKGGSSISLSVGESIRRIDLLYALLVCSANDAASVIACDVAGSMSAFVARMNARAAELGCTGTRFSCPHGLYDEGNYSTAHDLARIAAACAGHLTYLKVADTVEYVIPATNLHAKRTIRTTNKMLVPTYSYYRTDIHGMKTGFTSKARRCYVTFSQREGAAYGLVILGSDLENIYKEANEIFDWAYTEYPAQAKAV